MQQSAAPLENSVIHSPIAENAKIFVIALGIFQLVVSESREKQLVPVQMTICLIVIKLLKAYLEPSYCAVPENVHIHPKEG